MKESNNPFHDATSAYKSSDAFRNTMSVLQEQIAEAEKLAMDSLFQWRDTRYIEWLRYTIRRFTALASLYNAAGNISGNSTYFTYETNNKRLLESLHTDLKERGGVM